MPHAVFTTVSVVATLQSGGGGAHSSCSVATLWRFISNSGEKDLGLTEGIKAGAVVYVRNDKSDRSDSSIAGVSSLPREHHQTVVTGTTIVMPSKAEHSLVASTSTRHHHEKYHEDTRKRFAL